MGHLARRHGQRKWATVPSVGWGGGGWVEIEHRSTGALALAVRLAYQYNAARGPLWGWILLRLGDGSSRGVPSPLAPGW